jgi:hypothetical protein
MGKRTSLTAAAARNRLLATAVLGISVVLMAGACGGTSTGAGPGPTSPRATSAPSASHPQPSTPAPVPTGASGTWRTLPAVPVVYWPETSPAVWTGSQMIIHAIRYGGTKLSSVTLGYRPATNSWQRLARAPAPVVRQTSDITVWTG